MPLMEASSSDAIRAAVIKNGDEEAEKVLVCPANGSPIQMALPASTPLVTSPKMKLYDRETSGYSYKARLLLALLDVPYTRVPVSRHPDGRNVVDEDYLRLNPRGQIPTLEDDGVVLWGSTAILTYIALRCDPERRWLPENPALAGEVMQWMELAQNEIRTGVFRSRAIARFGYSGDLAASRADSAVALRLLERQLSRQDWLAGGHPTIGDIACFPDVALSAGVEINLADWPGVRDWCERIRALERVASQRQLSR